MAVSDESRATPRRDAPKAWGDDVALRGPNAPKDDGKIKHLIEYLLTVYERFGNTVVTVDLQWGGSALHKLDAERARIEELEQEVARLRTPSERAASELTEAELTVLIDFHDNQDSGAEAMGCDAQSNYHAKRSAAYSAMREEIRKHAAVILEKMVKP